MVDHLAQAEDASDPESKHLPPAHQRCRLDVAYHGARFKGWQIQPHVATVQGELEASLKQLYGIDLRVHGAGRTDAGVHALQQVAHFDLPQHLETSQKGPALHQLRRAINGTTPNDVVVTELTPVDENFHARFNPHQKTYAYHLHFGDRPHPMVMDRSHHLHGEAPCLDEARQFWNELQGTHDFGSFCSIQNDTDTTVRTIVKTDIEHQPHDPLIFKVQGKGFLQHMVRILAGTAIGIAQGKVNLSDARLALREGEGHRDKLGLTLPAKGLWLEKTIYVHEAP